MYWILMLAMLGGSLLLIPHGSRSQMLYLIIKLAILDYLFSLMYFSLVWLSSLIYILVFLFLEINIDDGLSLHYFIYFGNRYIFA